MERFETKLEAISKMTKDTIDAEYDFKADLHELIQALSHFLDRLMTSVWKQHGKPAAGKKKPNIYFPDCDDEAAFAKRMTSLQLGDLQQDAPSIYSGIRDVQSGFGSKGCWLRTLKTLANLKHERPLDIEKVQAGRMAIGVRQNLHVHKLTVLNGKVDFQGQAYNQQTGEPEAVKVQFSRSIQEILELAKCDPIDFVRSSIGHARTLAVIVHADTKY